MKPAGAGSEKLLPVKQAAEEGIELIYVNTAGMADPAALRTLTDGAGFDDVFVYAPFRPSLKWLTVFLARRLPEFLCWADR